MDDRLEESYRFFGVNGPHGPCYISFNDDEVAANPRIIDDAGVRQAYVDEIARKQPERFDRRERKG